VSDSASSGERAREDANSRCFISVPGWTAEGGRARSAPERGGRQSRVASTITEARRAIRERRATRARTELHTSTSWRRGAGAGAAAAMAAAGERLDARRDEPVTLERQSITGSADRRTCRSVRLPDARRARPICSPRTTRRRPPAAAPLRQRCDAAVAARADLPRVRLAGVRGSEAPWGLPGFPETHPSRRHPAPVSRDHDRRRDPRRSSPRLDVQEGLGDVGGPLDLAELL